MHDSPDMHQAPNSATDEFTGTTDYTEVMHNEFPTGASEFTDEVSRRRFLTVMSASLALAGAAGCNIRPAPQRKIVPYTTQPDEITPGVPIFYATAAPLSGYGTGVLVRSSEGRPTKIEGNIDHPSSLGGTGVFAQASLLDLYDPDRSTSPTHRGVPTAYEPVIQAVRSKLYDTSGQPNKATRLYIVSESVTSDTLASLLNKLLADFPLAKMVFHDPAVSSNARVGSILAFGRPVNAIYNFKQADVVLSLDADFLCSGPGHVAYSRDFASRRKLRTEDFFKHTPEQQKKDYTTPDQVNRLYAVECMPTNTGAVADHRLALTTTQIESFARALARELGLTSIPEPGPLPSAAQAWIKPLADDLREAQKPDPTDPEKDPAKKRKVARHRVVVVGPHLPPSVHALAHTINEKLEANGTVVQFTSPIEFRPADEKQLIDLKTLAADLNARQVDVLMILSGANPVYSTHADVPLEEAIKQAGLSVHIGSHQDETAVRCQWHVNEAHYLESWGDIRGHDGTASIQQPLIAPLYNGKSLIEFLADITATPIRDGMELVKATWRDWYTKQKQSEPFEIFWQEAVRRGSVPGTKAPIEKVAVRQDWARDLPTRSALANAGIELNYRPDTTLYDGRYANNGWLQELPKPLTKLSWDNAVFMSPATAAKLNIPKTSFRWTGGEHGRAEVGVVDLKLRDKSVKAPVWVLPGHADDAVTVHLGFGRTRAGRVAYTPDEPNAEGQPVRGFNAYAIRFSDSPWSATGATITPTGATYLLGCVQGRWSTMQKDPISGHALDRKPVRRGTVAEYDLNPAFAKIPPVAAGETDLIDAGVPRGRHHHDHDHDHHHDHEHEHDKRLMPLTMYNPPETLTPNLPDAQRRRWAMSVDLSACTGCSACVVACQSENNIPVVGKKEVTRGRIMHWINIDRYYGGLQEEPNPDETSFQPRMCVQCENAPCEVVCPVGATVHSADGLNDMAYNRCVGTRYCSNNCPYKVRRFNFLTYADWFTESYKLGRNPDVSVRSRGVMEKCTFCVQRIRGAEIVAEREGRKIADGEILTACQSACPSGAIMFGDLNDEKSVVARWKNEPTDYGLLAELNTRPRLTHMAVIRNPNPAMPKGA
jgi:molybdopterin-containing oxidoreductase family iron-sulfur binding subunit